MPLTGCGSVERRQACVDRNRATLGTLEGGAQPQAGKDERSEVSAMHACAAGATAGNYFYFFIYSPLEFILSHLVSLRSRSWKVSSTLRSRLRQTILSMNHITSS